MGTNPRPNGAQACAACKYQRRKCAPDCILAPYFPHHRHSQFLNAHKLFGVSNITKLIRNLHPPLKDEAMRTIIFQSDARASDPVGGCFRIIRDLHRQIDLASAELDIVLHHLSICRAQAQSQQSQSHHQIPPPPPPPTFDPADQVSDVDFLRFHHQQLMQPQPQQLQQQQQEEYVVNYGYNQDVWTLQDPSSAFMASSLQEKQCNFVNDECGGIDDDDDDVHDHHLKQQQPPPLPPHHHLDDVVVVDGDRLELNFEPEEFFERSEEGPVLGKDDKGLLRSEESESSIQYVQDHDLKGAATFFSLTN